MDRDTAIKLLIAHAVHNLPKLFCEDCPLNQYDPERQEYICAEFENKDVIEAVKVLQEAEEVG